jgi:cytosine/creatinine deaminase
MSGRGRGAESSSAGLAERRTVTGDLILRNARIAGAEENLRDVEVRGGVIVKIGTALATADTPEELDLGGRLVSAGLIETHIHLDKALLMERMTFEEGGLDDALEEVAKLKRTFTPDDVHDRAARVLEESLRNGTTHVRTHLEVDPGVGMRSFEGVWPLVEEYAWALDLEICVFPQEGLLNNPGTDGLMVDALRRGAHAVGGAPYTDADPRGQIDRIFEMAREFDVDIDMHFDFGPGPDDMDLFYLCDRTDRYSYGGRVTIGHVTKLAAAPPALFADAGRRLADAGVALTVLPSTDLYLMGRERTENKVRGVVEAHRLLRHGVNCSLSTNNVLNPFTPLGGVSLMRMANLYANIAQVGSDEDFRECFNMITSRSAALLNLDHYGIEVGKAADLVVFDATSSREAVSALSPLLFAFKRGARTVTNPGVQVHRPS